MEVRPTSSGEIPERERSQSSRGRLSFLLDASTAVGTAGSFRDALRALASEAVPRLADLCLIDVLNEEGRIERLAAVHDDPAKSALVELLERDYGPMIGGSHPAATVMTSRRSVWSEEMSPEFLR